VLVIQIQWELERTEDSIQHIAGPVQRIAGPVQHIGPYLIGIQALCSSVVISMTQVQFCCRCIATAIAANSLTHGKRPSAVFPLSTSGFIPSVAALAEADRPAAQTDIPVQ
jgi:hypothetical protein